MIDFGEYWAHAHDAEQVLFMSLAPVFLDSSPVFRPVPWLQEWKAYWLDHRNAHANGCSDIDLERFLDTEEKIRLFREFLSQYAVWLRRYGEAIPVDEINPLLNPGRWGMRYVAPCPVKYLLDFATKIEDVMDGNLKNEAVHRTTAPPSEVP